MNKSKLITICSGILLSALLLTGCGLKHPATGKVTVYWNNGEISFGGETVPITEYTGDTAIISKDNSYSYIDIEEAEDLSFLPCNSQGIIEDNMTKYKKATTYSEYMKTKCTMVLKSDEGNNWYVCQTTTDSESGLPEAQMQAEAYQVLTNIQLTSDEVAVEVGDEFTVYSPYYTPVVKPAGILIDGVLKVVVGSDDKCTELYTVTQGKKTYNLYTYTAGKYKHYTYGNYKITILASENIENYITFK